MVRNNQCLLIGNLGMDPVVRAKAGSSGPIVGFTVAENVQTWSEESKSYQTVHTNWFNVTAFGKLGERAQAGLKKGDRVLIRGRMKISQYKTQSGEDRNGFEIIAEDVSHWKPLSSTESSGHSSEEPRDKDLPF